jgi:hypothetical protein
VNEEQWQERVVQAAKWAGWTVAHFRSGSGRYETPVQYDAQGFPDLLLVHPRRGRVLYRELKVTHRRLPDSQKRWLDTLQAAGEDAAVWRPADWPIVCFELGVRAATP